MNREARALRDPDEATVRRTILVAIDFSAEARRALGQAVALASVRGDEIVLIHAPEVPVAFRPSRVSWAALLRNARRALSRVREEVEANGVPCEARLSTRMPSEAIAECAREVEASLIALARRGPETDPGSLGGVTMRVVQDSDCPVLVVPAGSPY